ncbi:protein stoned-B isoform X2 [Hetaerina americana]|uniref:protein stoned-B isoform X2 n=1 Tax=Hetaerina americana TaxID=62018 RepID=UPI003A7F157E
MAGANPFLSDTDFTDYGNADADVAVSHMGVNSNPFLSGSEYNISDAVGENPFLNSGIDAVGGDGGDGADAFLMGGGTNPFASDFSGGDTEEVDFFGGATEEPAPPTTTAASSAFQDIFSDVVSQDLPPASAPSPLAPTPVAAPPPPSIHHAPGRPAPPHPPPPRPPPAAHVPPARPPAPSPATEHHDFFGADISSPLQQPHQPPSHAIGAATMDLLGGDEDEDDAAASAETSQIMSRQENMQPMEPTQQPAAPGRPPPPRPAPPSRETQELILSVTGAMEATSSHLLDRLRATKTPSPTPIRDLHSPSPSPDPSASFLMTDEQPAGDLLGEGLDEEPHVPEASLPTQQHPPVQATIPQANEDFLDIFGGDDGGQSEPQSAEPQEGFPHAPPKPPPPVHPPTSNADLLALFESTPPVEVSSAPPETSTVMSTEDVLFSVAAPSTAAAAPPPPPPPPCTVTAAAPSSADLLMGDFVESEMSQPVPTPVTATSDAVTSAVVREEVNFLSDTPAEDNLPAPPSDAGFGSLVDGGEGSDFDAFAAKFESAAREEEETGGAASGAGGDPFDPFASSGGGGGGDAWGSSGVADGGGGGGTTGFGGEDDQFDAFLSMGEPLAPAPTPIPAPTKINRMESADSDDGGPDFSIFIKPKAQGEEITAEYDAAGMPVLAPPPKSPVNAAYSDQTIGGSRFNPFDKGGLAIDNSEAISAGAAPVPLGLDESQAQGVGSGMGLPISGEPGLPRSDSQETPPTPLFDEDVSQPLEDFPRTIHDESTGWEMQLRQPNKKKITGQRFWKKVYVKLVTQGDNPVLQLYNTKDDKDPFQELPLQPCYSISDISAQQYDAYGKIFTVKLQYVFYKERPGVRPGQVTKAERITNKLSQFAAYAIQGDYQGVKEFGSDLKKLGLPVEHAPQISQLLKLGSQSYEDLKIFGVVIEEALFKLSAHRDRALNYKTDEVQITAVDELYVEQNNESHVLRQIARVRVFFLGFLAGMPDIELGVNDMVRQGKEVVGRHDIIPVVTEEWIRLENVEFHSCVETGEYETTRVIKLR